MVKNGLFYILILVFLMNCEGPTGPKGKDGVDGIDGAYDKQLQFKILSAASTYNGPYTNPGELAFFKKSNYINVDSIVFVIFHIETFDYTGNDIVGEGTFELYDITNNLPIANSAITSDNISEGNYLKTANIFNNIPDEVIRLGVRVTSDGDFTSYCGLCLLILYRD